MEAEDGLGGRCEKSLTANCLRMSWEVLWRDDAELGGVFLTSRPVRCEGVWDSAKG